MPSLEAAAISGMLGVVVGTFFHDIFGGRRSSIGVHGPSGRLMPFLPGLLFFAVCITSIGFFTSMISSVVMSAFPGLPAIAFSSFGLAFILATRSYSR